LQSQVKDLLHLFGYSALYPPQELAISKGLMDGRNMLVTTPTASGKSLIALLGAVKALNEGKKVVYITPLKALAMEKFHDFEALRKLRYYNRRELTLTVSTGDYDSSGSKLEGSDIVILTNEKLDSIMRHGINWLGEVGLFIIDEVHLLGDRERGPTLEIILTKIKETFRKAQLIALSATISNSEEIGKWLGCEIVDTFWRPTKLIEGIYDYGTVRMNNNDRFEVKQSGSTSSTAAIDLAFQSVLDGGQALIFAETRRRAVSLATKAAERFTKINNSPVEKLTQKVSTQILNNGDADINKTLSGLVTKGAAFHHAGLSPKIRGIIEDAFKSGIIKILTATPTLGAGVNLPARRVIIANIFRYDQELGGNIPMSILEYKQLCGRAGRPSYDKFGESIIITDHRINSSELYDHYVLGNPEPLRSQLMNEKALRIHLLGSISSQSRIKESKLHDLFNHTFFSMFRDKKSINSKLQAVLEYLETENLIITIDNGFIKATKFGKRTSFLYIDPLTSVQFRENIKNLQEGSKFKSSGYEGLFLSWIVKSNDFYPKLSLRNKDTNFDSILFNQHDWNLYQDIVENSNSRSLVALLKWIEETTERTLADTIGVEPGDMYRMVESAEWLLHSLGEIAKIFKMQDLVNKVQILKIRMKFGVREELIPLIYFQGVGRIRARALFDAGIINSEEIRDASESKLAAIPKIGPALAKKLKVQTSHKR
jgi:helicase